MQLTFSDKLESYKPNTWFGMGIDDIYVKYDFEADYGVDDSSSILSRTDADTLKPRLISVNKDALAVDDRITYNQITDSEFYSEKDSSIIIGRNTSVYNGLMYYWEREEVPPFDPLNEFSGEYTDTNYFQLYFGGNDLKTRYKYIDYENNDDYAVVLLDKGDYSRSYVMKQNMYTLDGKLECWEDFLNPTLVPPETILQPDFRNIAIALVNPRTGEIYDTYPFFFARKSDLNIGQNCELYKDEGNAYNVYEQESRNSSKKPKIKNIITNLPDGRQVALKKETQDTGEITIPQITSLIRVEVDVGHIPNRDYIVEDSIDQSPQTIMRYMHYDVRFYYSGKIDFYNRVYKRVDITHQISNIDKSILICCKHTYQHNNDHAPHNNFFSLKYGYQFIIDNVEYEGKVTSWSGNPYKFKDRGFGQEITEVPTFLNMPVQVGFMPSQSKATGKPYGQYDFMLDGNRYTLDHIKHMYYGTPNSNAYFDNFAVFKTQDDRPYRSYYELFFSTYSHNAMVTNQNLVNYWACDSINLDMKSVPNMFQKYNYGLYNLRSDMLIGGRGKFTHEKEVHRILKDSIRFENVTGNSMLTDTWDNNGSYTLNFWFKSTQKTKGVIFTDIDRFHPNTRGIYIGVSAGGFLEFSLNAQDTRIYNTVDITDGKWHMITVMRSPTVFANLPTNSNLILRVDNTTIDAYIDSNANKDFGKENALYFMGHPLGNTVTGNLSRFAIYNTPVLSEVLTMMWVGDIEVHIAGTIILQNVPYQTEIRAYNNRTGELVSRFTSDKETGKFLYRNYENYSVYLLVMDFAKKFGDMQAIGPIAPKSLI